MTHRVNSEENGQYVQDVELNQRLHERYKLLFTKVVVPVMVVTTLFLVLSHWQPGNDRVFSGMVVIVVVAGLNVWLSLLKAIPTPWGAIAARSDAFDTLRWCVNFPFDGQPGGVIRVGMSAQQVEDMRRQVVVSGKIEGSGLGLQFVWRECVGNGFALAVESEEGEFCRLRVEISL